MLEDEVHELNRLDVIRVASDHAQAAEVTGAEHGPQKIPDEQALLEYYEKCLNFEESLRARHLGPPDAKLAGEQ